MKLNKIQLKEINGGGFSIGFFVGIGALIAFLIGMVDGYVRPLACNK